MTHSTPHWRADVQGLRAVAVIGVIVFHAGAVWLPGGFVGVDVFFVISGFLITGNLLREHRATGRVRLWPFWRGRIVRLAPAGAVAVGLTAVAAVLALPPLDRPSIRVDAIASLLGVENLWLASTGTDYLADHDASAFQQFWSLGVEEQFYLFWASTLAAALAIPLLRRHLVVVVSVIVALGVAAMIVVASSSGPWSFFGVHARAWEFAIGALVAVLSARSSALSTRTVRRSSRPSRPAWLTSATPVVGLTLVAASFALFTDETAHPGPATFLPVVGAALVVAPIGAAGAVSRVLGSAVLAWIGDRSYSLYLLHWPVMTIPVLARGRPLTVVEAVAAILATLVLGWGCHHLLEVRVPRWVRSTADRRRAVPRSPGRATRRTGLLGLSVAGVGASCLAITTLPPLHASIDVVPPTASTIRNGPDASQVVPENAVPSLASASDSLSPLYADGCHAGFADTTTKSCSFGSGDDVVVLFGDSHAAQWFTPLQAWASSNGKRLVTMTKSSCPSADLAVRSTDLGRAYGECTLWRADALREIADLRPEIVVLANASNLGGPLVADPSRYGVLCQEALERSIGDVQESGARAVVLQDTPAWSVAPNRALSASLHDVAAVTRPRTELVDPRARQAEQAASRSTGAVLIDPLDWLCTTGCSPVLWNIVVYRDANHLTQPMATALLPRLADALQPLLAPAEPLDGSR